MQTVPLPGLDPLALASTICARLCHDLAGSLGALTGTLELAAEDNDREALDLALVLARELAARLRLLRAAWGADGDVPAPETLLAGLPGADRLSLDTAGLRAEAPATLRLSVSLLLVAAAGLPRGGMIRVSGTDAHLELEIDGPRAGWPALLSQCLAHDESLLAACVAPRDVAVALACLQARALGRTILPSSATRLHVTRP
jgi:hypothetical protein